MSEIYATQPGLPQPTEFPAVPTSPENPATTILLMVTFCIWLLRQQSQDK